MPPRRQPPPQYGYLAYDPAQYEHRVGCVLAVVLWWGRVLRGLWRLTWRYRWQLAPLWVAFGAFAAAVAVVSSLIGRSPSTAVIIVAVTGALTLASAAGLWFGGQHVRLDRPIERAYAAGVALAVGTWTTVAIWGGAWEHRWPVLQTLLAGTILLGTPWWWHRRIRGRVETGIAAWRAGLESHEQGSSVGRPRFAPDGGCAIPWHLAPGRTIDDIRGEVGRLESLLDLRPGAIEIDQDEGRKRLVWLRISPATRTRLPAATRGRPARPPSSRCA